VSINTPRPRRFYSNAAAIITNTPADPAYIELRFVAAPMKFAGIVFVGLALALALPLILELVGLIDPEGVNDPVP